jgi:hypothetical protein
MITWWTTVGVLNGESEKRGEKHTSKLMNVSAIELIWRDEKIEI